MPSSTIRYAVVGLGHIAQVAVLPAFKHDSAAARFQLEIGLHVDRRTVRFPKRRD